jgi:hypothetical protein
MCLINNALFGKITLTNCSNVEQNGNRKNKVFRCEYSTNVIAVMSNTQIMAAGDRSMHL